MDRVTFAFLAIWFAIAVCATIHHTLCKSDERDELFNQICLRAVCPKGQGISIDEVMENLKNEDLSGFHLAAQKEDAL